ncbi:MAG: hypothetical protein PHU21_08595 [Elusimicrobia bacterium]|nr:hypothetical protein [Elusimicrobiota bacterium]
MRITALPVVCAAVALTASACFTMQVHPVSFHAPTPELGLAPGQKLPLRVAVVIPDPMGFRYYSAGRGGRSGSVLQDQTEQFGGEQGIPIPSELARLSAEAFPAAFQSVSIVRQLPAPGEYDAVVELSVTSVEQDASWISPFSGGGAGMLLLMNWRLSVLGRGNKELLSRDRTTERRRFVVKKCRSFYDVHMVEAIGREGGVLLSSIVRSAVRTSRDRLAQAAP